MTILTNDDLNAMEQRRQKARELVRDLCDGRRRWTMEIPVNPNDPDVTIGDVLRDNEQLLARVRELEAGASRAGDLDVALIRDHVFGCYAASGMTEGRAARLLGLDRLEFRRQFHAHDFIRAEAERLARGLGTADIDAVEASIRQQRDEEHHRTIARNPDELLPIVADDFGLAIKRRLQQTMEAGREGWEWSHHVPGMREALESCVERRDWLDAGAFAMFLWWHAERQAGRGATVEAPATAGDPLAELGAGPGREGTER